ncbi:MAG: hypothetical protein KAH01_02310 [Caldisericia bacterium]|nr:hypothetical protein [Caldisericia bacterium]
MKSIVFCLAICLIMLCSVTFFSCNKTPSSQNLSNTSSVSVSLSDISIPFSEILHKKTRIYIPESDPSAYIVYGELDGNINREAVIITEHPSHPKQLYLSVFTQSPNWKEKCNILLEGTSLDWLYLDKQFIYVGYVKPNSKKILQIYLIDSYSENWSFEKINHIDYSKLLISNLPGKYGEDDRTEIGRWSFDSDGEETVELFRLSNWKSNFDFMYADDAYKHFYPSIVKECRDKLLIDSTNTNLEIKLATFETYSEDSVIALQRIKRILSDKQITLTLWQEQLLIYLKCTCLNQLSRNAEAEVILQNFIPMIESSNSFSFELLLKKAYIELQTALLKQNKYSASIKIWEKMPKITSSEYSQNNCSIHLNSIIDISPQASYTQRFSDISSYASKYSFHNLLVKWPSFQEWGKNQTPEIIVSNPISPSILNNDFKGLVAFQVENMGLVIAWSQTQTIHLTPFYYIDSFFHHHSQFTTPEKLYVNNNSLGIVFSEKLHNNTILQTYQYLVNDNNAWTINWTSPFYPNGLIQVSEPNLEMVTAKGQILLDPSGKSYIFGECNSSTYHRYYKNIWLLEDTKYRLIESSVVPSPYQTLVEFLFLLYNDEIEQAKQLTTKGSLVNQTIELGIIGNTGFYSSPRWILGDDGEDIIIFRIKDRENVAFYFIKEDSSYFIDRILFNPDDSANLLNSAPASRLP